jgi:small subunit ribosomal protein S5
MYNQRQDRKSGGAPRAPQEFDEKVIRISRVTKKTKGGNNMSFTALVVVGDRKGRVGVALGKAKDIMNAIKKGVKRGKKTVITIPLVDNRTIPHELMIKFGAAKLILKPAPAGTGVIAGGSVRAVLELAGLKDVVSKILGTSNKMSNVTVTFEALKVMKKTVAVKNALGQTNSTKPLPKILK